MTIALEITIIGMGLVFGAIILLWLLMALLVKITGQDNPVEPVVVDRGEMENKLKAAAAAVGIALAEQTGNDPHVFPLPPTALVSAWQVVMRSKHISNRGHTR